MPFKVNNILCGNSINIESSTPNCGIAIGYNAGGPNTISTVAIGSQTGQNGQGENAIAIGTNAGQTNQTAGSIVICATGTAINGSNVATFLAPLRTSTLVINTITTSNVVLYNNTTKELFYSNIASTAAKTFVIDHPVVPERYLVHACLEGPEVGVYYRGRGTITGNFTTVELPSYTKDFYNFTISVTPIGKPRTFGVSDYVDGKFEVYSTPGDFFWVVYAARDCIDAEPYKSETVVNGSGPYLWV